MKYAKTSRLKQFVSKSWFTEVNAATCGFRSRGWSWWRWWCSRWWCWCCLWWWCCRKDQDDDDDDDAEDDANGDSVDEIMMMQTLMMMMMIMMMMRMLMTMKRKMVKRTNSHKHDHDLHGCTSEGKSGCTSEWNLGCTSEWSSQGTIICRVQNQFRLQECHFELRPGIETYRDTESSNR